MDLRYHLYAYSHLALKLQGVCVDNAPAAPCNCDTVWIGTYCTRLDTLPTSPRLDAQRAYPPRNGTSSWDGNAVYDSHTTGDIST